ncbi:MAG: methyltransferase domain-containing protein [Gallionella sp.]|jgi:hypothetical protein
MTLETLTYCPICHTDKINPVTNGRAPGSLCLQCGTVFANPRMDDATAEAFYLGAYRDSVNDNDVHDEVDKQRQIDRAHFQLHACWDWLEARTMLEIGCSMGYLMDKLNINFDTECIGVEPDTRYHAVDPACNYKVYKSVNDVPTRRFDLIAMSHSLEHMQHPREFLSDLVRYRAHLNTRFMIEVPNYGLTPTTLNEHHPYAFTEDTLNGLFERIGYKPLFFQRHGLTFSQLPYYLLAIYGRA